VRLLIAIPVFNEIKYVGRVLDRIKSFHPDVLAIDDGSTDGTAEALAGRRDISLIRHSENRGYGQSLIDAFAWADGRGYDWVITMDCDEQHEPEMIPEFIREIELAEASADGADVISGSRYLVARPDDDLPPGDRRQINQTLTTMFNELFDLKLTDSFCGFKAHRMSAMRELRLDVAGYAFPMQLWPQIAFHGLRVKEIAVRLIYNDPNRYFGGSLDDAGNRLRHYLEVLRGEMAKLSEEVRLEREQEMAASASAEIELAASAGRRAFSETFGAGPGEARVGPESDQSTRTSGRLDEFGAGLEEACGCPCE
jgi:dolichol-phosphate mannosyltransferase